MAANGWTDDPELVAIFRAEVEEKLASLREGLLRLEEHPAPKQLIASLFRDAHTVKGSARALALDGVVGLAHRAEDLLGALKDGRFGVRRDLVDLLLAVTDAISNAMPGADAPIRDEDVQALVEALDQALAGEDPVVVPRPAPVVATRRRRRRRARPAAQPATRCACRPVASTTCSTSSARPSWRAGASSARSPSSRDLVAEHVGLGARRCATPRSVATGCPPRSSDAVAGLVALGDQLHLGDPRAARLASRTPRTSSPASATAPWAWRWCRSAGSSPPSPSSCARSPPRPARTSCSSSRARTSSSTPACSTGSPTRSSTS